MNQKNNLNLLQEHLFKTIAKLGMLVSVFSVISNMLTKFPFQANIKWFILFLLCVLALWLLRHDRMSNNVMMLIFVLIISVFLPFAFFDSGGSSNNALGYTFLLVIVISYLFTGKQRLSLVLLLILVFIIMHVVEYYHPEIVVYYPPFNQFIDRLVQIPFLLFMSFLIIKQFWRDYEIVNENLNVLVDKDHLTGLYNRRRFNQEIDEVIKNSTKNVQLALIDMDYFKNINDTHGHMVGDEVLKKLANLLMRYFDQDQHIVARWGGDEFAIIYYGSQKELLDKLDKVLNEYSDYVKSYDIKAKFTSSVIAFDQYDSVKDALIEADKLLYQEKENNRVW
ncbi:MAG: GGDEF domain-containing protein [Erysipelotrichaceae bacterium]|nr:GGDEF domain-containing protein [Erysipelotrichaceae bacterium]